MGDEELNQYREKLLEFIPIAEKTVRAWRQIRTRAELRKITDDPFINFVILRHMTSDPDRIAECAKPYLDLAERIQQNNEGYILLERRNQLDFGKPYMAFDPRERHIVLSKGPFARLNTSYPSSWVRRNSRMEMTQLDMMYWHDCLWETEGKLTLEQDYERHRERVAIYVGHEVENFFSKRKMTMTEPVLALDSRL